MKEFFTKTFSLSQSYGMIPEGKLPFSSLLPNDSEVNLEEVELVEAMLLLETRFYLKKKRLWSWFLFSSLL